MDSEFQVRAQALLEINATASELKGRSEMRLEVGAWLHEEALAAFATHDVGTAMVLERILTRLDTSREADLVKQQKLQVNLEQYKR